MLAATEASPVPSYDPIDPLRHPADAGNTEDGRHGSGAWKKAEHLLDRVSTP